MEKINNLLNQVSIIDKKNFEILEATGGRFNMFRVCGVNHYENTHSAIIAEFLNPKGTHGLKSKLLECFIETLGVIQDFNHEESQVYTEYSTKEGRIDILIKDNQNRAIIIENKIYAGDQSEQLKRYDKYAQDHYKNGYKILYLTLHGDDASEQSAGGVSYLRMSHKCDIINWLEKCVAIASRFPIVRETIIQYINHLKQLTNQDMDTKNKEEIAKILSKSENLRAAQTIYQNYFATFDHLTEKHFSPKMEEFAKENGLEYHYEKSEDSYIKFNLTNPNWKEKSYIGFSSDSRSYYYGLANYRLSDENQARLHKQLKDLGVASLSDEWWSAYSYLPYLTIDNWENDIINSDVFFNDCKEKIKTLLVALNGIEL